MFDTSHTGHVVNCSHDVCCWWCCLGIGGKLATQPIATLSGGQKTRVVLATVTYRKPHILLLDEPTNHLDFESIQALTKVNPKDTAILGVLLDSCPDCCLVCNGCRG